jgi:uroporphyrinogen-III synthase
MVVESIMNFLTKKARALRQSQTKAENKLWQILRNRNFLGLKFRRQHPIKNFIVDFCCIKEQLIIELDGESHNNAFQQNYDDKRTQILKKLGYTILRFENKIVFEQPEFLLQEIKKSLTPTLSQRRGSYNVLSTKKLSSEHLDLFKNTQIDIETYNAITIEKLLFEHNNQIENAIVTSQNAAQILIGVNTQIKQVFCVGEKTSKLFLVSNYKVVKTSENASELANFIIKNHKKDDFTFFCGNIRRDELPDLLTENIISFSEEIVYKTTLNSQKFNEGFDGILFFSPSGVQSYIQENSLENSVAFCIGNTTANEAKKHTRNVIVANQSTIEDTIAIAIRYFKS